MPLTGLEEFKDVFGSITVLNVVELLLAILFCYLIYRKVSKYLIERYEAGKKKDEQLKTALDQVSKYPEYRAQSLRVQKELQTEIDALHSAQSEQIERLKKMEDDMTRRERNRLRDRLLQSYRYYTDPACNPAYMEHDGGRGFLGDVQRLRGRRRGRVHPLRRSAGDEPAENRGHRRAHPRTDYPGSKHSES